MTKHRKHAKLKLRDNDNFSPNEIAILGTTCNVISDLVSKVSENLSVFRLAYMDASHSENAEDTPVEVYTFHSKGSAQLAIKGEINKFNQRVQFAQYDLLFINGNHFRGKKQILILDPDKEASVKKRLSQLDNIAFVIKVNEKSDYFDFLVSSNPQIKDLVCYSINDLEKISKHIFH